MLSLILFVLRGQPKAPERVFALKVQTNILYDSFQTDRQTSMEDTKMLASASTAKTNTKQTKNTAPAQTDAHSSCNQSSSRHLAHTNKLICFDFCKFCTWFAWFHTVLF